MVYAKKLKTAISSSTKEEDVAASMCSFRTTQEIFGQIFKRL